MPDISKLTDEELLNLRFRDLGIKIEGTWLEPCIAQLYRELDTRGIEFHPNCYLADEWLCPDEEPIIGIPFYLAHPRLKTLEKRMMLEVEGGDKAWCMKLLRHECGHTINYAYYLYRRKKWRELFGHFSEEYEDRYKFHPYSKRYVRHLDDWYAQYHPDEDFAETFAVWLTPNVNWRKKYADWKALEKLEYVDTLMRDVSSKAPKKPKGEAHWNVSKMRSTLRSHYKKKRNFYAEFYPDFHDFHLKKIFSHEKTKESVPAAKVIRTYKKALLSHVALCTGERKFMIARLLTDLAERCTELKLFTNADETGTVMKLTAYVTTLITNYAHTGSFRKNA